MDPLPEVLLLHVTANQTRYKSLLWHQICTSFVLPGVHALVGGDHSLQLNIAEDAVPFIEEKTAFVFDVYAIVFEEFVGGDSFFCIFEIGDVDVSQQL